MVNVLPSFNTFANPKSVNFKYPSVPMSRFSGFKSRNMMLLLCKYSKARVTIAP